jgi:hypothetical protein
MTFEGYMLRDNYAALMPEPIRKSLGVRAPAGEAQPPGRSPGRGRERRD